MSGEQQPLFASPAIGRARRHDVRTSQNAGARAARFARGHAALILRALAAGPGTPAEIGERCGLNHVQVGKRRKELLAAGAIRRTGVVREGAEVVALA